MKKYVIYGFLGGFIWNMMRILGNWICLKVFTRGGFNLYYLVNRFPIQCKIFLLFGGIGGIIGMIIYYIKKQLKV